MQKLEDTKRWSDKVREFVGNEERIIRTKLKLVTEVHSLNLNDLDIVPCAMNLI